MGRCILCHMLQDGIKEKGVCFNCWSEQDLELFNQDVRSVPSGQVQMKLDVLEEE